MNRLLVASPLLLGIVTTVTAVERGRHTTSAAAASAQPVTADRVFEIRT